MPKKRKKNRKAPSQRSSRRSEPTQQASSPPAEWEPEWDGAPEDEEDEEEFVPLRSLADQYPTPAHAVKAVASGERVEWTGDIDGAKMRHRVMHDATGAAVVEQAVFLDGDLEKMVLCAAHQAGEKAQEQLQEGVLSVLDALHAVLRPLTEARVREVRPDYTAAVLESFREAPELHGPGTPVFGWHTFHSIGPDTTWEDTIDTATWNSSLAMSSWIGEFDDVPELQIPQLVRRLRDHDVPVVLCAHCERPITDRHPRWAGVWVTPDSENGPVCETAAPSPQRPAPRLGLFSDDDFGDPHRPDEVPAR
ncbi:hypothetical protein [Streptomyces sp. NPDC094049]|uniref:hypothetical protein n=1 Tax=Streptomyces sp. NPDC094049 TaxID=3154987 RepID=UPI00332BA600